MRAAAQVKVPATFILGERDMMTPAKAGKALAAATPNARTIVLPGAGHMMMVERPTSCSRHFSDVRRPPSHASLSSSAS